MVWMGVTGTKVVSKLAALLLSAYAVMMIRVGFFSFK
jgi:small neutral amino acid transporter SnatA (MarC family)